MELTLAVLYENDKVEYQEEGVPKGLNKDLLHLLAHPMSRLTHEIGSKSMFVERELGSKKDDWYLFLMAEITECATVPAGGICSELSVQINHDKNNVHGTIWVSELKEFFAESELPRIQTAVGERFVFETACADKESFLEAKDYDEMLQTIVNMFISCHYEKHGHAAFKKCVKK